MESGDESVIVGDEATSGAKGGAAILGVSRWILALAATAGVGVGVGASFAVGRSRSVEAPTVARVAEVAKTQTPKVEAPVAVRDADTAAAAGEVAETEPKGPVVGDDGEVPVAPGEGADKVDPVKAAAADRLVETLAAAHARAHAKAEAVEVDKALNAALDEVFKKAKVNRRFAGEFYTSFGAGRFVKGGVLTALGAAVIDKAHEVDKHALDPAPYDLEGLDQALAGVGRSGDGEAKSDAVTSTVAGLLEAPAFDKDAAKERLLALPTLPDDGALELAIGQASSGKAPSAADVPLDVRVFRTFLDLVMDFRFLKKAGPFMLRTRETVYERDRKALKDHIAVVLQAAAEGDAAKASQLIEPAHPQYRRMIEVLAKYREIDQKGGCPKLSSGWRFRAGSRGNEVVKLQERLACEGYYAGEMDGKYDGPTAEAVKAYQEHHDLPVEGLGQVLEETMKSLNVPIERRVKQIELAVQRMREGRHERMGEFFLRVNIPSFLLRAYENGQVVREHRVIVGTNKLDDDKVQLVQGHINRTKLFGTRLYEIIVNPTWILPKRVEEGELASNLDKDATYLEKSNIKKVKLGSGTEVFVQGAGKGNVLGKVKFLLEGTNAIYLHDTDKRALFKKQRRDFSHGCMRVHEAIDFGKWLLARDGFTQAEIDKAFGSSVVKPFDLKKPIDLVTEYITVDLAADGNPVFYDDIYGYDAAFWNDKIPPVEKVRWGSEIMRPRWVPTMDNATVDGWRKAGKPAPRNLGPDGKPVAKPPKDDTDQGP